MLTNFFRGMGSQINASIGGNTMEIAYLVPAGRIMKDTVSGKYSFIHVFPPSIFLKM